MCFHAKRQDEVAVVQDSVIKSQHSIINCQRESECGKIATKIGHLSEHEGIQSENGYADESADNSSIQGERPRSPVPSVVSMKSDKSMGLPPNFSGEVQQHIKIHLDRPNSPGSMLDSEEDLQDFYIASEMTDGGEEVLCAVCTKRAGKFCLTCVAHFCEIHVRQHYTAPALQRHRLVGVTDWDRHLCDLHHRALEFFCQTDQVSICACCAVDDHRQHDVVQQGGHKSVQRKKTQIPPNIDIPPPGQVSIAAVKPEAVFLKWVNPEGLSGPLKFRVSWRCRLNTHHRFIDVKNSEVQIQGLIPGEEYAFTVATLSSDGGHSFGVSITASTEVPPPKNLTVETKVTSVSVNWKKPAGVAEVSYLLTLSRDEEHQTLHTDSEEHIFNHLKLEMEYSISVLTALSTGAQSKPVFKVISTCIPIPGNLEVGSVTAASASLSWSMPSEMDEIPHSFLVSYHSKATEPQTISTDTCSAVLTGLTPDSEHSVSICTKLQDGRQGQPAVTSFQTGIPSPEMVEFTSVQPHAVALRWEPPKGLAGLYRYKVSWRGGGMLKSLKVSTRNVEARGLAPGEKYEFTVATLCDNDRQSPHAVATVQTEIPVPEHVRVESDMTSLSVKWEKPGGLKEVSYQLTLSRNEECQAISTDSLEHCFSALSPGTKYSVSVSTVFNDCQSKLVWNTTCTTIPVPEELAVDSVTLTSATISWSVPSVMEQTPHSFLISYHSEGAEPMDITTDAYNNVITGLKPGIEYMVCVCVVCENTGKGQPASTSINIGIPIPENLEVGSVTAASASLSWSMPSQMDEIPHSFLVSYHSKGTEPQTISTDTCSAVLTGLTPDSEHSVSIFTKLQDGRQGQPAVTSFQTVVPHPEKLTEVSVTATSAEIKWNSPRELHNIPHSFLVSVNGLDMTTNSCNITIPDLEPGTEYIINIITKLNDNLSEPVAFKVHTVVPSPKRPKVESMTTSAVIKWSSPDGLHRLPHHFLVNVEGTEQTIRAHECSYNIINLKPGTDYTVNICTELEDGRRSEPFTADVHTFVPAPEEPIMDSQTATSVKIKWNPPHELHNIPHSFRVSGNGIDMPTNACNMNIKNLKPGTEYIFSIRTKINERLSEAVFTKTQTVVPHPEKLKKVSVTATSAEIKWNSPCELHNIQHSFLVSVNGIDVLTNLCNITIPDLEPGTEYIINIVTKLNQKLSKPVALKVHTESVMGRTGYVRSRFGW